MTDFAKPPFDTKLQDRIPGQTNAMTPLPDHGEESYEGSGRLEGKTALITGGDSGIGRAVAIGFAREGADIAISFLPEEEEDAQKTKHWIEKAGRKALLLPGDLKSRETCKSIIDKTMETFGKLDVLVNNAAFQVERLALEDISEDEWDDTFATNIGATFRLTRHAVPHMKRGASIIHTISVNADSPKPRLLAYSATKAAIQNFSGGLAQLLGEKGIRSNTVAPGPIWTPLIPATMHGDHVHVFGEDTPLGRPGQPVELIAPYVMLASDEASYISGATIAVTGGTPVI
ncbi:SDR family oxidoreductase [Asaia lannensis]|uniref:SDR family oxidoreductase n=1 Tax=Asaia lannensis NBRC 102526 TaxID=1307926 RepID=A0ABT1CK21_9PROT|nr:SDR family oxidoreductase [Asaia lannensis]MCO6160558.1 SDR family oxidoreductase [Asaia lannensis NBRC 102526]GBQ95257.1 dehydrogenase [Asaia lannensis NBRC 102526]